VSRLGWQAGWAPVDDEAGWRPFARSILFGIITILFRILEITKGLFRWRADSDTFASFENLEKLGRIRNPRVVYM
jgi:hypothetical protein